jgi:AcrR family transcriptional regulator
MADSRVLLSAPGRGQYDRRQSREARLLEQRARILAATAAALAADPSATVAAVVELAGVSRNTFYEYFDDLDNARDAAERRAEQRIEQALRAAEQQTRTPVERWRALTHAWLGWASEQPSGARLILRAAREGGLSAAGRVLETAFARSLATLRASGVSGVDQDALRVTAVAAAGEAFARRLAVPLPVDTDGARAQRERARVERALVDVAVRLLR